MSKITVILTLLGLSTTSFGNFCSKYDVERNFSLIDASKVFESSGISSSIDFPGERFYHNNDSGSGASFHVSFLGPVEGEHGKDKDEDGIRDMESTMVEGAKAGDVEGIDVGYCLETDEDTGIYEGCVYLADIGDNDYSRKDLKIFITAEKKKHKAVTKMKKQLNLSYEDGQHNAEAFLVHPNGDIYIVTKKTPEDPDETKKKTAKNLNPRVYKISRKDYSGSNEDEVDVEFKFVKELPIKKMLKLKPGKDDNEEDVRKKYLVTDADFSPDGRKFVLLTLGGIVEASADLLLKDTELDKTLFKQIPSPVLSQQEAITYSSDGRSLIYTSEKKTKTEQEEKTTELLKLKCVD